MTLEMERTRALELKAFHEKEEIRSKLEEMYEERDRIEKVLYVSFFVVVVFTLESYSAEVELLLIGQYSELISHQRLVLKMFYLAV